MAGFWLFVAFILFFGACEQAIKKGTAWSPLFLIALGLLAIWPVFGVVTLTDAWDVVF